MYFKRFHSKIVRIVFYFIILLSILIKLNCVREKSILAVTYPDERPCVEEDKIGVWKHLGLSGKNVTAIAVHPQKPHVIFAGTSSNFSTGTPAELFLSTDCGHTWVKILNFESSIFKFTDIKFNPDNPNVVYATPLSIIKSTDGGIHWREVTKGLKVDWETRVSRVAIDPVNSKILYVGTAGFYGGSIYKSTDGGETWRDIAGNDNVYDPGDPDIVLLKSGVTAIAINPENPNIIYAGIAQLGHLLKSTDAGKNWHVTGLVEKLIYSLAIHPQNSDLIYAATADGLFKSSDGGNTWHDFNEGLPDSISARKILIDATTLKFFTVITKCDIFPPYNCFGGIFVKETETAVWKRIGIDDNLNDAYYYTSLCLTSDGKYLYFGSQFNGIYRLRLK